MSISRRRLIRQTFIAGVSAATRPARLFALQAADVPLSPGRFSASVESLAQYRIPEWFNDAKFGIWAHWGPQSAIEAGDWYARNMYIQGSAQYLYHAETYGHPSRVGYKDLIPTFKAAKWDPGHLMDLYKAAGARYFFSMGVHHDNFDMWNSKYQPRWNAVATGPKKDIVGLWSAAARSRGLYFGVSEHLSNSYNWLRPAHTSDKTGPWAGVPYDGQNLAYSDLYHDLSGDPADEMAALLINGAMSRTAPTRWKQQYFRRIKDLIDQHHPDLLYTDGGIPFGQYGLGTVAELYNVSEAHTRKLQAVYFSKDKDDCAVGTCALDRERGVLDEIAAQPWQSDTCIGDWHYRRGVTYKSGKNVVDLLVDIVSKNGNLLLNIPLPNSGEPDCLELATLNEITVWMKVNGEGIYGTRPWTRHGEGPGTKAAGAADFNENKKPELGSEDVRFTRKGTFLYAFVMGWPKDAFLVRSLGTADATAPKIANVTMLGYGAPLHWAQTEDGLRIEKPAQSFSDIGYGFKILLA